MSSATVLHVPSEPDGSRLDSRDGNHSVRVREYQQEILEAARAGNVVAFLETGSGKTLISALLAKEFLETHPHQKIVMLVPTKLLVPQQAGLFNQYVSGNIGQYTGDRGVDIWAPAKWREEIRNHKILIMTPAILDDLLMCGNLQFREISLLIFDEAHHCAKGHPYAQIMRKYAEVEQRERPHVFGMTASPVNTNVKSKEKLLSAIAQLEQLMDSTLVTIHDDQLQRLQQTVPMPETDSFEYTIPTFSVSAHKNEAIVSSLQHLLHHNKLLELTRQHENLRRKLESAAVVGGDTVGFDDRGPLTRAEAVGDWLVNKLCFTLLQQGPFCAALVLQDYFRNCSSDGRLSTIGAIGAETMFYATAKKARPGKGGGQGSGPGYAQPRGPRRPVAGAARAAVEQEMAVLLQRVAKELPQLQGQKLPPAEESLRSALAHAVLLCVRMLVSDPVLADCLSGQVRELLFAREPVPADATRADAKGAAAPFVDTNMHSVAAVLEAAIGAVPPAVLQAAVLAPDDPLVAAWSRHMLCDILTDKVCCALRQLYHAAKRFADAQPGATWAALVFAERQSCSLAMDLVVKRIPALKERLVTGTLKSHNALMSTTNQGAVISQFRNGDLNALFCTSVAEEGLDIQKVSLVICYDIPKRPLSMVQTVGRARSRESRVLFMRAMHASGAKAKENMEQMAQYSKEMRQAVVLRETLDGRQTPDRALTEATITLGGKAINSGRARTMLHQYIQALTHWKGRWQDLLRGHKSADRRGRELRACQPRYSTHKVVDGDALQYEVTLHLPASSPFRVVRGQRCASPAAAKDSAIMSGVVYLWQSGVFGENLRPTPPKDLLDLEKEMEEEDADPNDWRSRQTLRRPQQFKVMRQPPLHLDLRHAPLDEAAAVGPHCFVATHFHLYVFESSRLHEVPSMEGGSGNGASGGRQAAPGDGGLGMCLGLLLLQELPELPPFTVYEAAREEGQPPARYQCCLRYCRTVNFSLEQLVKAQRFHCKMVQAARGNKAMPDPLSPEGTTEAISNETWVESSGGAFYVIVPVCAPPDTGGGKAHKSRCGASPRGGGAAVVDERAIDSALHPSVQGDNASEDLHTQIMALMRRRLDPAVGEARQVQAAEEINGLLSGRVLSTLHRPSIAYRYQGISRSTIRDRFPDERQQDYATYLEYFTKRYDYPAAFFNLDAPLLHVTTATSAVKDINCLVPPRPQPSAAAAAAGDDSGAEGEDGDVADDAESVDVDPEGVPLADGAPAAAATAWTEASSARTRAHSTALSQESGDPPRQGEGAAHRSCASGMIDLVSTDEESAEAADTGERTGEGAGGASTAAVAAPAQQRRLGQREVLLPLELCRVHRLKEELLRSLQFLPALIYRVEGLLAAHEMWRRIMPPWLPRPLKQPAFTLKVLEALTPQGTRDAFDSERYELLGDGVLKGAAAKHVYLTSGGNEGHMSLALCRLVSNGTLLRVAVWTKDVQSKAAPSYTARNRHHRSITESVRAFPYGRAFWRPPGFERHDVVEEVTLAGKKGADALEALIGVVFEAAGEDATEHWLAYLGILPGHKGDPTRLPQEPSMRFLEDVKAAAVAAVAAARAMPRTRLTAESGKEATLPPTAQLQRPGGRAEEPPGARAEPRPAARAEDADRIARAAAQEQRQLPHEARLAGQFAQTLRVNVAENKVQEQLRAIVGEPEMLVQINEALNDAPRHLPGVAAPHPHLLQAVNAHLHAEAWQHAAQQRRVATRLAATTAVTTSKTFRPRQVQQQVEQTVEDILGYRFRDEALLRSCLIHSSFVHEAGEQDRLEFLGDAMLGTCVTAFLFYCLGADRRREVQPEQLHNLRALLVQNDTLAFMAVFWGLDRHLRHSSTHLGNAINSFKAVVQEKLHEKAEHPEGRHMGVMQYLLTAGGWDMQTMDHPKALGDILEAAFGAVTLDCGHDMPQILQVVLKVMDGLRGVSPAIVPRHPVSVLHEVIAKLRPGQRPLFEYVRKDPENASAQPLEDDAAVAANAAVPEVKGVAYIFLKDVRRDISGWFRGGSERKVKALCAEDALRRLADDEGLLKP